MRNRTVELLRAALAAGQAKDHAAMRDALVAAWRVRRSPAVADLVALVEIAAPDALTAQLAALTAPRVATTLARFAALDEVDDPRLATWAIEALARLPFTAETAKPLYFAITDCLRRLADPRLAGREAEIRTAVWTRINRLALRKSIVERVGRAIRATPVLAADPAAAAVEAALSAELEPLRKTSRSADALLAEIYANPEDDAPRLVYADVLTEQGDPRGELIALQLERAASGIAEASARETELLKKHGKAWLGRLAPVISWGKGYSGSEFRRGFLAVADIILSVGNKLEPICDDPAWATIEVILGSYPMLVARAPLRALRVASPSAEALAEAARRGRVMPALRMLEVQPELALDLADLRAVCPNLETIRCTLPAMAPGDVAAVARYGTREVVLKSWYAESAQLAELRVAFARAVDGLVGTVAPGALERLTLLPPFSRNDAGEPVVLVRDRDGRLRR